MTLGDSPTVHLLLAYYPCEAVCLYVYPRVVSGQRLALQQILRCPYRVRGKWIAFPRTLSLI